MCCHINYLKALYIRLPSLCRLCLVCKHLRAKVSVWEYGHSVVMDKGAWSATCHEDHHCRRLTLLLPVLNNYPQIPFSNWRKASLYTKHLNHTQTHRQTHTPPPTHTHTHTHTHNHIYLITNSWVCAHTQLTHMHFRWDKMRCVCAPPRPSPSLVLSRVSG